MRYPENGNMATQRKISYEELEADLAGIFDELARDHETLLVEKDGRIYTVGLSDSETQANLLRTDPEAQRRAVLESAGALRGVDIEQLRADLREMRQQDSKGRPG